MSEKPYSQKEADAEGVVCQDSGILTRKATGSILIVEDSKTQAEYLRAILEEEGYHTVLAKNGFEALKQIAVDRPMMVLTDIIMPDMGGYELCRKIKQDQKSSDIPVILVTRLFNPEDVVKGLASGADNFIIKPFKPSDIRSRIRTILSQREKPGPDESCSLLEVSFGKTTYVISSSRLHILNILLSTYEAAVNNNTELQEAQEQLNATHEELISTNEQLLQAVTELRQSNQALELENTERKRVEKTLDEVNKKLNLLASITRHDINNQLMALMAYLALLEEELTDLKLNEYCRKAATAAERISSMIRFMKEYEEIGITAPTSQDIRTLVTNADTEVSRGPVVLKNDLPSGTEVFADPLIAKVFYNLMDNAVRYGGKITMVRFSLEDRNGDKIIVCEDDGDGVATADKERIFGRGCGKNTGLGLALSREILNITGITIKETGEPGKGARFEIVLPPGTFRQTG